MPLYKCLCCKVETDGNCQGCDAPFCSQACLTMYYPKHREHCVQVQKKRAKFLDFIMANQPRYPGDPPFPISVYKPPKMFEIDCIFCKQPAGYYCDKCETAYCSTNCQRTHWPVHKLVCVEPDHDDDAACGRCDVKICFWCKCCHNEDCDKCINIVNWSMHRVIFPDIPILQRF